MKYLTTITVYMEIEAEDGAEADDKADAEADHLRELLESHERTVYEVEASGAREVEE
jgi:hypothetical protein